MVCLVWDLEHAGIHVIITAVPCSITGTVNWTYMSLPELPRVSAAGQSELLAVQALLRNQGWVQGWIPMGRELTRCRMAATIL